MGLINDEKHVQDVCRPSTKTTCRYLTVSGRGWCCEKGEALQVLIDERCARGTFRATGDNCGGR